MSSIGAAPGAAIVNARAEASRINGAKSRGPKTAAGKARSSQNALKHGLRAERFTVVGDEDEDDYDAHERALLAELAPEGVLQTFFAERIARAAWRLARADTIEAMLFDRLTCTDGDLGLALIRDGNNTRAFETLLRYRAAAQAELMRTLRTLKTLQAEAAAALASAADPDTAPETPDEPEARTDARTFESVPPAAEPKQPPPAVRAARAAPGLVPSRPNEPRPALAGQPGPKEPR